MVHVRSLLYSLAVFASRGAPNPRSPRHVPCAVPLLVAQGQTLIRPESPSTDTFVGLQDNHHGQSNPPCRHQGCDSSSPNATKRLSSRVSRVQKVLACSWGALRNVSSEAGAGGVPGKPLSFTQIHGCKLTALPLVPIEGHLLAERQIHGIIGGRGR